MDNVTAILIFVAIAVVLWWTRKRSRAMLNNWAQANGFEIVHSEYRIFRRGPFLWNSSKNQTVYYVKTRDRLGYERTGWVRLGSYWWGIWSDETVVRWKDQT